MSAAGDLIQRLRDEATCSICRDYFKDPVHIPGCGHNFCRSCLIECWGELEAEASCPQCRKTFQRRSLIPNWNLPNVVEIAKNLSLQEGKGEGVCKKHRKLLKLFCKVHEAPICVVCVKSKEHKNHKAIPLEEALDEYKDMRSTLQRYENRESPEKPLPFPPSLKQFKANVTLDPDTAHPCLILSEDRKSVRLEEEVQDLPDNPERFNCWPFVLGREGFTAGRHFWEVNVESGDVWTMGVARKSVMRKGYFSVRDEGGIWAVGKFVGKFWAHTSTGYSLLSLREEPRRIRVTLDYEGGHVSFYDADSGSKLYTFSGASFSGETLLPIFYLDDIETHLSIS
nr:E3 ubiquitin-protein ligase TRIM39-like [Zootoca vivipara]